MAKEYTYARLKKAAHEARYEATQFRSAEVGELERGYRAVRDAMLTAFEGFRGKRLRKRETAR